MSLASYINNQINMPKREEKPRINHGRRRMFNMRSYDIECAIFKEIKRRLSDNEPLSTIGLMRVANISKRTLAKTIKSLEDKGVIKRIGKQGKGGRHIKVIPNVELKPTPNSKEGLTDKQILMTSCKHETIKHLTEILSEIKTLMDDKNECHETITKICKKFNVTGGQIQHRAMLLEKNGIIERFVCEKSNLRGYSIRVLKPDFFDGGQE